jgi:hypothetical protein
VKGLFTFVMKGRAQAVMGIVVSAMLALLVTPFAVVSAGWVVLATLRNGMREGLWVVLLSALAMAGLGALVLRMPLGPALLGLLLWLPAWGLATVLGRTGSLARALEAAALGGFALVGLQYLVLGDPAAYWQGLMQQYASAMPLGPEVTAAERQQLLKAASAWMAGGIAGSWMLLMALALMFGRWGQAVLDRAGAFAREFRSLRVSRGWLLALPVLLGASMLGQGPNIAGQWYLVGTVLFVLQGLSVAHALVAMTGAGAGWLFGLYFVLVVGLPHSVTAVAAAGYADGWLNFRAKVRGTGRPPGPE